MTICKIVKGGVCSAKGFRAAGVAAEIKYKGRNDVALIVADEPCAAAAVFTTNKVAAAPVLYDREVLRRQECRRPELGAVQLGRRHSWRRVMRGLAFRRSSRTPAAPTPARGRCGLTMARHH